MQSSKDVENNLGHNVKTRDKRGSRFPGNICEGRKEGQVKRAHRRIDPSQGLFVIYIITDGINHIKAHKEGDRCQGVGSIIQPT